MKLTHFFLLGGPAREIAHFTGAHITGLNNNDYQISRAFHYAKREGLADQTDFIKVWILKVLIVFRKNSNLDTK